MMRALVLVVALTACVRTQAGPRNAAPTSYGSSSGTQVYRTTASGSPVSGPSSGAAEKDGGTTVHPRNELLRAGIITLAVSYVSTVVIGQVIQAAVMDDFAKEVGGEETIARLWLPVIGPWAALVYNETTVRPTCESKLGMPGYEFYNCDLMTPSSVAVAIGAIAQTTGVVLIFAGLQRPPKPVKHEEGRITIIPHGNPGGGAGVVLSGQF